ncbi:hypothetical protein GCM10011348_32750 [Marinobacterium nitratireducens]|uniref:Flagellar hook-length control protein-like C-terminal domain-containing protein n=1 Tax=Marinobacterium nitratireducens TaxID=518897 RepID=A0A917ZKV2_9GAMM|nr:flagellar hook-length control protein FliK [Marinobacterium nitratireducens]GGO85064.1 hypothetical protein GCM10011348_32750 [Marinobacterium nitratireducens]
MISTFVPHLTAQATPGSGPSLSRLLPAGQTLNARVLQLAQMAGGGFSVRLQLGAGALTLATQRAIAPGTDIQVRRDPGGQIAISLSASPAATRAAASTPDAANAGIASNPLDSALRASLPRQMPTGEALAKLAALPLPSTANGQQAAQLVQALLQLLVIRPGRRDAATARRAVEQGGFFSEAQLARTPPGGRPAADLKTYLGQLARLGEQLPADAREPMQKLVESLLARVTTQQLASVRHNSDQSDGSAERHFRLDLPVTTASGYETVRLDVRRRRPAPEADERQGSWRIRLHFELDASGPLDAEMRLLDDGQLSARFWAASADTARRVEAGLAPLAAALESHGIRVNEIHCRQGKPPGEEIGIQRQLIDLKT